MLVSSIYWGLLRTITYPWQIPILLDVFDAFKYRIPRESTNTRNGWHIFIFPPAVSTVLIRWRPMLVHLSLFWSYMTYLEASTSGSLQQKVHPFLTNLLCPSFLPYLTLWLIAIINAFVWINDIIRYAKVDDRSICLSGSGLTIRIVFWEVASNDTGNSIPVLLRACSAFFGLNTAHGCYCFVGA